jgi:hypothetical protein
MSLHPAENRGYRELYLSGRQAAKRLDRLASRFTDSAMHDPIAKAAESIERLLSELAPLTARHDLHGSLAAEGTGANLGALRAVVLDRFLERNQAVRLAVDDLEHLATLLGYLASAGEARGDPELPEFCGSWERRLRRQAGAVRRVAKELAATPDTAIRPLDESPAGRAAHLLAWTVGSIGEWTDRQVARRLRG